MGEISELQARLREFARERDWEQFHTPENLAKSISIEAGELLECFQWEDNPDAIKFSRELADVAIYLLMLSDVVEIDLVQCIRVKIEDNAERYPISKCKGKPTKAEDL